MALTIYETNFQKLLELCPELPHLNGGSYRFSESSGFMKLNLDVLERAGNVLRVALSHYYKHESGDMIADPDMELRIDLKTETVEALTYQDIFRYQVVSPEPGKFYPKLRRELNHFLSLWLNNCINQGHSLSRSRQEVAQ